MTFGELVVGLCALDAAYAEPRPPEIAGLRARILGLLVAKVEAEERGVAKRTADPATVERWKTHSAKTS